MAKNANKVHFPRRDLLPTKSGNGNLQMFCGKVFASGDRERLRKHVTGYLEDVNCPECVEKIQNLFVVTPSKWWFHKKKKKVQQLLASS